MADKQTVSENAKAKEENMAEKETVSTKKSAPTPRGWERCLYGSAIL